MMILLFAENLFEKKTASSALVGNDRDDAGPGTGRVLQCLPE